MAVNPTLVNIFTFLQRLGLVDVLLPFVLVFVIVYGILDKVKILGKDSRNANLIVAMVMGFLVVGVINYVNIINDIVRLFGLLVIMVICFAIIYGLFGNDLQFIKKKSGASGGSTKSGGSGSSSGSSRSSGSGPGKSGSWDKVGDFGPGSPPFNE